MHSQPCEHSGLRPGQRPSEAGVAKSDSFQAAARAPAAVPPINHCTLRHWQSRSIHLPVKTLAALDQVFPGSPKMLLLLVGKQAADAAAAAAALRAETMLRMPLWQHLLKLLATVGAVIWAARLLSRLLHLEADRVAAGDVRSCSLLPLPRVCSHATGLTSRLLPLAGGGLAAGAGGGAPAQPAALLGGADERGRPLHAPPCRRLPAGRRVDALLPCRRHVPGCTLQAPTTALPAHAKAASAQLQLLGRPVDSFVCSNHWACLPAPATGTLCCIGRGSTWQRAAAT